MKMHIHIHHYYYYYSYNNSLNSKLNKIMAKLQDLNDKVDHLQHVLNEEQAQIAAAIAALQKSVDDLQAIIVDGGTEAERQAVSDKLDAVIADLQSTIPDTPPSSSTTTSTTLG